MEKPIQLIPGDFFGTRNPMALGRGINAVQWFWSKDGESKYSHSGIITSEKGDTYEARWWIRNYHLSDYIGEGIVIARFESLNQNKFFNALQILKARHDNQFYPFWRIPLHIFPPLAKFGSWKGKWVVCSELTAEQEYLLGLRHSHYTGTNPDTLADEWHRWQGWIIIAEGILRIDKEGNFWID